MKCRTANKKTSVKIGITQQKIFEILLEKYDCKVAEGEKITFEEFCRNIAAESKAKAKASKNIMHKSFSKVTEQAIYKALDIYENNVDETRPPFYEWCRSRFLRREE